MTLKQISALGRKLTLFLALFADCFGRCDARKLLWVYVRGQLSNLHRKTAETIALQFKTAPRTLQRFLESIKWNEEKLRDRCQEIVAQDHAHPEAIGCIDESGVTKTCPPRHVGCATRRNWPSKSTTNVATSRRVSRTRKRDWHVCRRWRSTSTRSNPVFPTPQDHDPRCFTYTTYDKPMRQSGAVQLGSL